jgi:hypothetical protein
MRVLTFAAVLQDRRLELQPGFVTEGEPSHEEGELRVDALGRGRRPLATTMLPLRAPCGHPGGEMHLAAFGLVAFPERATGLRVSLDGSVLLEQMGPPEELEVDVDWPVSLSASESVRWRASADKCVASLGYSNDGGETWTPLALPGPGDTIEVNARALPGGRESLLELIVTDGFHTQRIRSDAYEVEPKGWVLWILSPPPGAALPAGEPVLLAAQGYHFEERRAGFDDIEWESSAGGGLGRGARVLATLEPGEHTITARMYDVAAEVHVSVG